MTITKTPGLTNYIDQLDDNALVGYLTQLGFDTKAANSEEEDFACVHANNNDSPCVGSESAHVLIAPELGAHKWKHDAIGKFGVVVALIYNSDKTDRTEANFKFPADTAVWWVVDRDPVTNVLRSRYFKRNGSPTHPSVDLVGTVHEFLYCDHQHKQGHSEAIAKYVSCSQSLTMATPSDLRVPGALRPVDEGSNSIYHQASFTSAVRLPAHPELMQLRATWITCDVGCCSTSR